MSDEKKTISFDDCDFYSALDAERLTHESPGEAIEDLLATAGNVGESTRAFVERCYAGCAGVTVDGYRRDEVTDEWMKHLSRFLAERVAESFSDDLGDPDGSDDGLTKDVIARLTTAIADAIGPIVRAEGVVWRCSKVASHTYTADEVVSLIGEE
jgi:hypothetical protein